MTFGRTQKPISIFRHPACAPAPRIPEVVGGATLCTAGSKSKSGPAYMAILHHVAVPSGQEPVARLSVCQRARACGQILRDRLYELAALRNKD